MRSIPDANAYLLTVFNYDRSQHYSLLRIVAQASRDYVLEVCSLISDGGKLMSLSIEIVKDLKVRRDRIS